jgi:hypothetical protein
MNVLIIVFRGEENGLKQRTEEVLNINDLPYDLSVQLHSYLEEYIAKERDQNGR